MQEDSRDNREWEHWPGRKPLDDGIRHRLKALFAATDETDPVDALISDRGREIEAQTEQLQETIQGLERREEQAAKLRAAVEEMLRHGSAELDERHAALTALALELGAREEQIHEQQHDLALRRQELGAVELRRAAVERREDAAAEREAALELAAAELRSRGTRLGETARAPGDNAAAEPAPEAHILVLPDAGWRIVEQDGAAPVVDSTVDVDGRAYVVTRLGRSTLPGDRRPSAYLEPARRPVAG